MTLDVIDGTGNQAAVVGQEELLKSGNAESINEVRPADESESEMLMTAMELLGKAIERAKEVA